MDAFTPLRASTPCPYCDAALRRVPGRWLGRSGFECPRCGDFIDFSRPVGERDQNGMVDEPPEELTEPD